MSKREEAITFKGKCIGNIKRKGFLGLIKQEEVAHSLTFWENKFNGSIPKNLFTISWNSTKETRLRALQWKITMNIYPTNILLHKMGIKTSSDCTHCKERDYLEHFFAECALVRPLWREIEKTINVYLKRRIILSTSHIMIGINESTLTKKELQVINHAIIIGKMCIS